jgi:hypothetical protein
LQAELGGRIEEEERLRQELAAAQQVIQAQRKELDRYVTWTGHYLYR